MDAFTGVHLPWRCRRLVHGFPPDVPPVDPGGGCVTGPGAGPGTGPGPGAGGGAGTGAGVVAGAEPTFTSRQSSAWIAMLDWPSMPACDHRSGRVESASRPIEAPWSTT